MQNYTIKPLDWEKARGGGALAYTSLGIFIITKRGGNVWWEIGDTKLKATNVGSAKVSCEMHYYETLLPCLTEIEP